MAHVNQMTEWNLHGQHSAFQVTSNKEEQPQPQEEKEAQMERENELLLLEPLSELMERGRWSEIEARQELRRVARDTLRRKYHVHLRMGSSIIHADGGGGGGGGVVCTSGTTAEEERERETEEEVRAKVPSAPMQASPCPLPTVWSLMHELPFGSDKNGALPDQPETSASRETSTRTSTTTAAAASDSLLPSAGAMFRVKTFPTGLHALDEALLGGIRTQFLTEWITAQPQQRGLSAGTAPIGSSHHEHNPNRVLMARVARRVVRADDSARVWWWHPTPRMDAALARIFDRLDEEDVEKAKEAPPSGKRCRSSGGGRRDPPPSLSPPPSPSTAVSWYARILLAPVESLDALIEASLAYQKQLQQGKKAAEAAGATAGTTTSAAAAAAPPQLIVLEDIPLLTRRSFGQDESSSTPSSFPRSFRKSGSHNNGTGGSSSGPCHPTAAATSRVTGAAQERMAALSTLVDVWKSIALEHNIAVVFLTTAKASLSFPSVVPDAQTAAAKALGFHHDRASAMVSLRVSDELSRAFSHAMNIRLCLYPGWFMTPFANTTTEQGNTEEDANPSEEMMGECSPPSPAFWYRMQILKSPISEAAVIPFQLFLDRQGHRYHLLAGAEGGEPWGHRGHSSRRLERKDGREGLAPNLLPKSPPATAPAAKTTRISGRKREMRQWIAEAHLLALDPVDYLTQA